MHNSATLRKGDRVLITNHQHPWQGNIGTFVGWKESPIKFMGSKLGIVQLDVGNRAGIFNVSDVEVIHGIT